MKERKKDMAILGDLITCKRGHHYDPSKHRSCPVCNMRGNKESVTSHTPRYAERSLFAPCEEDEVTKGVEQIKMGFTPIAGWLVAIDGINKGKDYHIRLGRNFVGRDRNMDICLQGDVTVSRSNHGIVTYDSKAGKYYYSPGMGRSIDYVNEHPVFTTVELRIGDILEIGSVKLRFIPLCGERFQWEDLEDEEM